MLPPLLGVCVLSECFISLSWLRPRNLCGQLLCLISRCAIHAVLAQDSLVLYSFYRLGNGQQRSTVKISFVLAFIYIFMKRNIKNYFGGGLYLALNLAITTGGEEAFRPAYLPARNFWAKPRT